MSDILIGASIITAFVAGIAALFAPCCITVLLPAYLGSIFRQKRTVFLMTFVFFLGLLSVFLPLGLGAAGLGQLFREYHDLIFISGGLFLLFLGATILLGRHFSFPFSINRGIRVGGAGSVFVLGIFSGFATLCCAPVLAGVIALSVLPGSLFWGGLYSLAYVLGMAIPLFVIAFFIDKTNITERLGIFKKQISYSLAGKQINLTVANIVSGITFFLMGALILYLAETGQLAMGGGEYQITINVYLAKLTYFVNQYLGQIPAIVWVIIIVAVLLLIIKMVLKRKIIS